MADTISEDHISLAMVQGLDKAIRDHLRKRIEAIIKPDIDDAINAAMKKFKAAIESSYSVEHDMRVLKVILEDRRT